jgi:hypothetical protein
MSAMPMITVPRLGRFLWVGIPGQAGKCR